MKSIKVLLLLLCLSGSLCAADEQPESPQCSLWRTLAHGLGYALSPFSSLSDALLEGMKEHATAEEIDELRRIQEEEESKKKKDQ